MPEPYPYSEMSAENAAWHHDVLGISRRISFPVADSDVVIRFRDEKSLEAQFFAKVSVGSSTWWIGISDWDRLPGADHALEGGQLTRLPIDVLPAVLESIYEHPLDAIAQLASVPCEVIEFATSVEGIDQLISVRFQVEVDGSPATKGFVAGDKSSMDVLRDLILKAPVETSLSPDQTPLRCAVEIGRTQLSLDALSNLNLHDVVMIASSAFGESKSGLVRFSPSSVWRVSFQEEGTVTFEEPIDPPPLDPCDDLQVEIVFEKGQILLKADELVRLQSGKQVTRAYADEITLSSNGTALARGELVQIGDRFGARLLTIQKPSHGGDSELRP